METWKDIPEYGGYYQSSDEGRIRSVDKIVRQRAGLTQKKKGKILSPSIDRGGYYQCALSKFNKLKSFKIHQLVARAHIKNPNNYKEINHIDCNKLNNHVSNLEWCTRSENINHAERNNLITRKSGDDNYKTLIKSPEHKTILELKRSGLSAPKIAKIYKCSYATIYKILDPIKYKKK